MADSAGQHTGTKPFEENGHAMMPLAQAGRQNVLNQENGTTAFDATALPASSGTWRRSAIIDVRRWRRLVILAKYLPGAGGTNGRPVVIPFRSNENGVVNGAAGPPSKDGDTWQPFSVWDATVAAKAGYSGAFATTTAPTAAGPWGVITLKQAVFTTDPANATTNVIELPIELDVTSARWVQLQAAEDGDTAHLGTLRLYYALTT